MTCKMEERSGGKVGLAKKKGGWKVFFKLIYCFLKFLF